MRLDVHVYLHTDRSPQEELVHALERIERAIERLEPRCEPAVNLNLKAGTPEEQA